MDQFEQRTVQEQSTFMISLIVIKAKIRIIMELTDKINANMQSIPENQFARESMNITVGEIVQGVCDNPHIPPGKVPEIFIRKIANILLSIKEVLPSYGEQICLITSELLKCAYEASTGRNAATNHNFYDNDSLEAKIQNKITELYGLEKKIKTLSDEKFNIYSSLFSCINANKRVPTHNPNSHSMSINENPEINSDFLEKTISTPQEKNNNSSLDDNLSNNKAQKTDTPQKGISYATICHAVERSEKVKLMKQETCNHKEDGELVNKNLPEPTLNPENIPSKKSCYLDIRLADNYNEQSYCDRVSYNIAGSVVCCLKAVKRCCVAGTVDGKVLTFSKTGILGDVFQAHSGAVTSIVSWKPRLITTSLDSTMSFCDLEQKTIGVSNVGYPIQCSREKKGVLYLGMTSGHIVKYNVRAFTRVGKFLQVSSTIIKDLEVLEMNQVTAVAIASEGKPVSIRCAKSGSLLWISKCLEDIHSLAVLSAHPNYLCGINPKGNKVIRLKGNKEELILQSGENLGGHILEECDGFLYFAGVDGNIYICGGKDPVIKQLTGTGEAITGLTMDKRRVIFSTCTTVTEIPLKEAEKNENHS